MPIPTFDFEYILQTLVDHQVDFIVIGGVCAVLHGAPITTLDLDLVHSRTPENLQRLVAALQELQAYYREPGDRRLIPSLPNLASPGHHLLTTKAGSLDILGTVSGNRGYDDLLPHTKEVQIGIGLNVHLLDLPTLIMLKEEVGREKDKVALPILRRTLEETKRMHP